MDKEETPQVTRRTTRSLALATTSNNDERTLRKCINHKPSINDLIYMNEPLSVDDLLLSFPGRQIQITEVLRHFGPLNSPMLPLFVYGGTSTGKTSTILQIFRHLKRPFVYSSCITCYSPRILFESILNQLALHLRDEDNAYSSTKKCEKPSDFINFLREALVNILNTLKGNPLKSSLKKATHYMGNMIYLVIDNMELLREWDKSSILLPFLFGLYHTLGLPEVGIIFISKSSPDTYYSNSGHLEPVPIYFPGYTEKDLRAILLQKQENKEIYSSFLDIVLKPFYRVTRRVDELSAAFSPLYKKYCLPLNDPGSVFGEKSKQKKEEVNQRLYRHLAPHIGPSLNEIYRISSSLEIEPNTGKAKGRTSLNNPNARDEELEFHMSIAAKYLLISAFLASRNPATLDASLFDSTGGLDGRKKRRKSSAKTIEKEETAEQELLLKGPGTFPLERLLAIFQCITSVADIYSDEDAIGDEPNESELASDVLLQLSSLCNANFISKGGSCPLEGSTRYKSTVSEELALKIARSLKFPLSRYLYRR